MPAGHVTPTYVNATQTLNNYKEGGQGISQSWLSTAAIRNPVFDGRIARKNNAGGLGPANGLLRGRLVQYRQEAVSLNPNNDDRHQRTVNFLYNPEDIKLNYSFDTNAYPSASQQSENPVPVLGSTGTTMSWVLHFNRMYEVAYDKTQENMGVLADVQALEYMLGTKDGVTMSMVEVMAVFGATPKGKPFAFIGFISDMNVHFSHFSRRMIPTVATVEIGLVRRYIPNEDTTGGGDSGSTGPLTEAIQSVVPPIFGGDRTAGPATTAIKSVVPPLFGGKKS